MGEFFDQIDDPPFDEENEDLRKVCEGWWETLSFSQKAHYKEHQDEIGPPLVAYARKVLKDVEQAQGVTVEDIKECLSSFDNLDS